MMTPKLILGFAMVVTTGVLLSDARPTRAQAPALTVSVEKSVTHHAKGNFDVKVTPLDNKTGDANQGHYLLEKTLHGELEGTTRGQMLTAGTAIEGSAGYVAVERFSGSVEGRCGDFVLQHKGTMRAGVYHMAVTVLPDS